MGKKIIVSESRDRNIKSIKGMELEAKVLSSLDHPNIIKIRAISKAPFDENSFLIIDRLHSSLVDKIHLWNKKESFSRLTGKILDPRGKKKKGLFLEKLMLAYNLSSAMTYIHKNSVIHRDLKPENIGFDKLGRLKLFDFGLAKELLPENRIDNDLYKLTGGTGTLRYMAPEVVNRYPYGKSADVWSFAILVWQILTCTLPYETFSVHTYKSLVVDDGYRLELDLSWPRRISDLVRSCWSHFPKKRPSFEDIKSSLSTFLEQHVCHNMKLLDDVPTRTIQNRKNSVKPSLIAGMA